MTELDVVRLHTERFRTSQDPLWICIRRLLMSMDFDPDSMAVAYFEPEDFKFRFGVLVNGDGRVFRFGFDFAAKKSSEGTFSEWEEISGRCEETPYARQVGQALEVLEGERRPRS